MTSGVMILLVVSLRLASSTSTGRSVRMRTRMRLTSSAVVQPGQRIALHGDKEGTHWTGCPATA
jgi:hypothetical protein